MTTKLQELLEELKELKQYSVPNSPFSAGIMVYKAEIDQLITKYTETINYSESDNICDNCKFCIGCKNDDGRWVVCNNEKNRTYIKEIDRSFGCILFEPIN